MHNKKFETTIFGITFIDALAFSLVFPLLPKIVKDTYPATALLSPSVSNFARQAILGLLLATYPLIQLFAVPILGSFSDKVGRKKILMLAFLGNATSYALFSFGIFYKSIWFILLGNMLAGLTGANLTITQSLIADFNKHKSCKVTSFNLVNLAVGVAFIIGPSVGGFLFTQFRYSILQYLVSPCMACLCSITSLLLVKLYIEEPPPSSVTKTTIREMWQGIYQAVKTLPSNPLYAAIFFIVFGWTIYHRLFTNYLMDVFGCEQEQIGNFMSYIGAWSVITQAVIVPAINTKTNAKKTFSYAALSLCASLIALVLCNRIDFLYFILPLIAISQGVWQPNAISLVSKQAPEGSQGRELGFVQSLQSLSKVLAPFLGSLIMVIEPNLAILSGCVLIFGGFLLFRTQRAL